MSRRELKIYGQFGSPGQPEKLSFNSLVRQLEDALQKGYKPREVISAVTRAISPGSSLRSYLEGRADITLPQLRRVLRAHYKEKGAIDLYTELAAASQQPKESPHDFFMRAMSLRQKVIFASQEDQSPLKYDTHLVQSTFIQTLKTGLAGNLKDEMRQYLQQLNITDEELLEKLNPVVSLEDRRAQKRGPKVKVNTMTVKETENIPVTPDNQTKADIQQLTENLRDLTACVASLQGKKIKLHLWAGNKRQVERGAVHPAVKRNVGWVAAIATNVVETITLPVVVVRETEHGCLWGTRSNRLQSRVPKAITNHTDIKFTHQQKYDLPPQSKDA